MNLYNFISQSIGLSSISNIMDQVDNVVSKFFKTILEFNGILNSKYYHFECRFTNDQTVLDINLVDFIPFHENGLTNLQHENVCIIYFCNFDWNGKDQLNLTLTDDKLIPSTDTKEVKHIYLFRKFWKQHISLEEVLDKPFPATEFEKGEPEARFIMGYRSKGLLKKNTKEMPLISIVMPTFNSEKTLEQSIQSVVYQNYPNYEFLIIDGLSKDRTLNIVRKYEKYIDGVISEKDVNIFDAINKGTYASRGEYSVFLGSDDLLMPFSLAVVAREIQKGNKPDYFYGDGLRLKENKKTIYTKTFINAPKVGQFQIMHTAMYITKKIFEKLNGFDIQYYINADSDFKLKLIKLSKLNIKINRPLAVFRSGGNSSYAKGKISAIYKVYRKHNSLNFACLWTMYKVFLFNLLGRIFGKGNILKLVDKVKGR